MSPAPATAAAAPASASVVTSAAPRLGWGVERPEPGLGRPEDQRQGLGLPPGQSPLRGDGNDRAACVSASHRLPASIPPAYVTPPSLPLQHRPVLAAGAAETVAYARGLQQMQGRMDVAADAPAQARPRRRGPQGQAPPPHRRPLRGGGRSMSGTGAGRATAAQAGAVHTPCMSCRAQATAIQAPCPGCAPRLGVAGSLSHGRGPASAAPAARSPVRPLVVPIIGAPAGRAGLIFLAHQRDRRVRSWGC